MIEAEKTLNDNLEEVVLDLDTKSIESIEREKLNKEINELRIKAKQVKDSGSSAKEIEDINSQIEDLLQRIKKLK